MKLSVNIDHVATIRQARRGREPRPVEAARVVQAAGAHGITVHIRLDRRHIQEYDIHEVRDAVALPLNIEMACDPSMLALAEQFKPQTVTLVPEDPREVTTRGGLRVSGNEAMIERFQALGARIGFRVSLFVDPDVEQLAHFRKMGIGLIEINTARYTEEFGQAAGASELDLIRQMTAGAADMGMIVAAGHGLNLENLPQLIEIPRIEELNIGHSIVARSVFVGLGAAVKELLALMPDNPSPPRPIRGAADGD